MTFKATARKWGLKTLSFVSGFSMFLGAYEIGRGIARDDLLGDDSRADKIEQYYKANPDMLTTREAFDAVSKSRGNKDSQNNGVALLLAGGLLGSAVSDIRKEGAKKAKNAPSA